MAAKVSDNDCVGFYNLMKDIMESVYNKGVERGKFMAKEEAEAAAAERTQGNCGGCCRRGNARG